MTYGQIVTEEPLAGLDGPIEIIRDQIGVPHCYAATEHDAFFAQGWVHATDRLWQMEYDRRRALGRWAEVIGSAGVASDLFYRRIDLASSARRDWAALAPRTKAMLEAYSAGASAGMKAKAGRRLPRDLQLAGVVPETWEPWHSLLVFKVRHVLMGSARQKLWRAVAVDVLGADAAKWMLSGRDHLACVPPGAACEDLLSVALADEAGSNNWALSGSRTASGLPLLAGDPHRVLELPNVYVQGHLSCPAWDVLGIGMAGVAGFPHFGHNQQVAWCITHGMIDDQDLYRYPFPPGGARRTETVQVRNSDPVEVEVVTTPRGPLLAPDLALCWTATAETDTSYRRRAVHARRDLRGRAVPGHADVGGARQQPPRRRPGRLDRLPHSRPGTSPAPKRRDPGPSSGRRPLLRMERLSCLRGPSPAPEPGGRLSLQCQQSRLGFVDGRALPGYRRGRALEGQATCRGPCRGWWAPQWPTWRHSIGTWCHCPPAGGRIACRDGSPLPIGTGEWTLNQERQPRTRCSDGS